MRSFLGATGYVRRAIPGCAYIANPLTQLTKDDIRFVWGKDQQKAFALLVQTITSEPCIVYPDYSQRFLLFCDASDFCIGACLAQTRESVLKPIGYFSRTLSRTQLAWPIVDKEGLSIIEALGNWRSMLMLSEVTVYTDNMAAKYILMSDRQSTARRAKLVAHFSENENVTLQHIAGSKNQLADFLSRIHGPFEDDDTEPPQAQPIPDDPNPEDRVITKMIAMISNNSRAQPITSPVVVDTGSQTESGETLVMVTSSTQTDVVAHPEVWTPSVPSLEVRDYEAVQPIISLMAAMEEEEENPWSDKTLLELVLSDQLLQEKIERLQQRDEYMNAILNYLRFGKFESSNMPLKIRHMVIKEAENYQVLNKLLYTKPSRGRTRLVVPKALREQLIFAYHDNVTNAHRSAAQTYDAMKRNYYWQCMRSDIVFYVQNCTTCSLVKRAQQTIVPPMRSPLTPQQPGTKWSLDFLERLVETPEGFKHVLIAVENTTTFVVAEPVKDLTAETVAEFIYRRIFTTFGIAKTIHSDNGAAFRGRLVQLMSARLGVEVTHSLPMHSRGNPHAERSIQRLQRILQMYVSTRQNDWAVFVPAAQHAMNTTVNRTLNETPFYLMFARDPRVAHDLVPLNFGPEAHNNNLRSANFIQERAMRYSEALKEALQHKEKMQGQYKHYYDRSVNDKVITVGSRVYCRIARIPTGRSRALTKGYFGPLRVLEVGDVAVKCVPVSTPHAKPGWIAKRRLKVVVCEHTPSYEEPVVKHWEQLMKLQEEEESQSSDEQEDDEQQEQDVATRRPNDPADGEILARELNEAAVELNTEQTPAESIVHGNDRAQAEGGASSGADDGQQLNNRTRRSIQSTTIRNHTGDMFENDDTGYESTTSQRTRRPADRQLVTDHDRYLQFRNANNCRRGCTSRDPRQCARRTVTHAPIAQPQGRRHLQHVPALVNPEHFRALVHERPRRAGLRQRVRPPTRFGDYQMEY